LEKNCKRVRWRQEKNVTRKKAQIEHGKTGGEDEGMAEDWEENGMKRERKIAGIAGGEWFEREEETGMGAYTDKKEKDKFFFRGIVHY
jgi:hypothetical protein